MGCAPGVGNRANNRKFMTHKQIKAKAAHFAKFVEWSDKDQCFIGRCPELFGGGVHGQDEAKVYAELCEAVEEWVELLDKDRLKTGEGFFA